MQEIGEFTQQQKIALASLKLSHGIKIGVAAKQAGVPRAFVQNWIATNPAFGRIVAELRESLVDDIETTALLSAQIDPRYSQTMLERLRPEVYGDVRQGGGPAVVVQVNSFDSLGGVVSAGVTTQPLVVEQQHAKQLASMAIDADAITVDLGDWGAA